MHDKQKGGFAMILKFMTKRNVNGHRSFLNIDTDARRLSYSCDSMIPESERVEVTAKAMRTLRDECKAAGFIDKITL